MGGEGGGGGGKERRQERRGGEEEVKQKECGLERESRGKDRGGNSRESREEERRENETYIPWSPLNRLFEHLPVFEWRDSLEPNLGHPDDLTASTHQCQ